MPKSPGVITTSGDVFVYRANTDQPSIYPVEVQHYYSLPEAKTAKPGAIVTMRAQNLEDRQMADRAEYLLRKRAERLGQ